MSQRRTEKCENYLKEQFREKNEEAEKSQSFHISSIFCFFGIQFMVNWLIKLIYQIMRKAKEKAHETEEAESGSSTY